MTNFNSKITLLAFALESELPCDLVVGWQEVYNGVGKV